MRRPRRCRPWLRIMRNAHPEIVFHLAAQPLVRPATEDPLETFATNVMGTANCSTPCGSGRACASSSSSPPTSVPEPRVRRPYREDDALGGHDPYSASKAAAELVMASYRDSFFAAQGVAVATARAGNVIGGGDWAADRLVPDCVRAWEAERALSCAAPAAVRPWQHVLEPLCGLPEAGAMLWQDRSASPVAYNFGPHRRGRHSTRGRRRARSA